MFFHLIFQENYLVRLISYDSKVDLLCRLHQLVHPCFVCVRICDKKQSIFYFSAVFDNESDKARHTNIN